MIRVTRFDNGVTVTSRDMPGRRSAALGLWIARGSRDDPADAPGLAHLVEHLLYRGVDRYDGLIEGLGGRVNACTSREWMLFHGTTTGEQVDALASVLAQALSKPAVDAAGLLQERNAILQEIAAEPSALSALQDEFLARIWPEHPLARPAGGLPGTMRYATAQALRTGLGDILRGPLVQVVACGPIDPVRHDSLVEACRPLALLPGGKPILKRAAPAFMPIEWRLPVASKRSTLVWAMPVAPFGAGDALLEIAERVMAGDSGAGRLPRILRDRLGLVYGVDSQLELYSDCGLWWLYLECDPSQVNTCRRAVEAVFRELAVAGPEDAEIRQAQACLKARGIIEDDDPEALMERIARESARLGCARSLDERLAAYAAVDPEAVRMAIAAAWKRRALVYAGPDAGVSARPLCA